MGAVVRSERDDPRKAEGTEYDGVQSVKVLLPTVVGERPALAGLPHLWSVHHLKKASRFFLVRRASPDIRSG